MILIVLFSYEIIIFLENEIERRNLSTSRVGFSELFVWT